jgi:hypothetical protein
LTKFTVSVSDIKQEVSEAGCVVLEKFTLNDTSTILLGQNAVTKQWFALEGHDLQNTKVVFLRLATEDDLEYLTKYEGRGVLGTLLKDLTASSKNLYQTVLNDKIRSIKDEEIVKSFVLI